MLKSKPMKCLIQLRDKSSNAHKKKKNCKGKNIESNRKASINSITAQEVKTQDSKTVRNNLWFFIMM